MVTQPFCIIFHLYPTVTYSGTIKIIYKVILNPCFFPKIKVSSIFKRHSVHWVINFDMKERCVSFFFIKRSSRYSPLETASYRFVADLVNTKFLGNLFLYPTEIFVANLSTSLVTHLTRPESLNPFAKGLLSIFNRVIWNRTKSPVRFTHKVNLKKCNLM